MTSETGFGLTEILALLGAVLGTGGFAVSLWSFLDKRAAEKRLQLMASHESLVSVEQQEGRELMYKFGVEGIESKLKFGTREWRLINHSLAMLDVTGFYREEGWIPGDKFIEIWRGSLARLEPLAAAFVKRREGADEWPNEVWPHLRRLLDDATRAHDHVET